MCQFNLRMRQETGMGVLPRLTRRFALMVGGGGRVVRWCWVNFKLSVPGRPSIWIIVGQGPTALAVGAGGVVWTFFSHLSFLSSFSLSFGDGPI